MFNYLAAIAAFSLFLTAPAVAQVAPAPEPTVIPATCTPTVNGEQGTAEACNVVIMNDGVSIGVGFVFDNGARAIYAGLSTSDGRVDVKAIGFGGEPSEATGVCAANETAIACTATVATSGGNVTVMVKAVQ